MLVSCHAVCAAVAADAGAAAEVDASDSISTFFVPRSGSGTFGVREGAALCTFTFQTHERTPDEADADAAAAAAAARDAAEMSATDLLDTIKGKCVRYEEGFWTYTICVGRNVEQRHGQEVHGLGTLGSWFDNVQHFTGGEMCAGHEDIGARRTDVVYGCGDDEVVKSMEEVGTCHYTAVVTSPKLCGHAGFPDMREGAGWVDNGAMASVMVREPWLLEVERTADGAVHCRAFSTDDIKKGIAGGGVSNMRWDAWRLTITERADWLVPGDEASSLAPLHAAARKRNRQLVTANGLQLQRATQPLEPVVLAGGGAPSDGLEFVSLEVACR